MKATNTTNFATTTILTSITNAQTTVSAASLTFLPATYPYAAVIFNNAYGSATDAAHNNKAEVVYVTGLVTATTLTIARAAEPIGGASTGLAFASGCYFTAPPTAGVLQEMVTLLAPKASPILTGNVSTTGAITAGTTNVTGMTNGDIKADRGSGVAAVFLGSSGGILYNDGTKYYFGTTAPGQLPVVAVGGFEGDVTGDLTGTASKVTISNTVTDGRPVLLAGPPGEVAYDNTSAILYDPSTKTLNVPNLAGLASLSTATADKVSGLTVQFEVDIGSTPYRVYTWYNGIRIGHVNLSTP